MSEMVNKPLSLSGWEIQQLYQFSLVGVDFPTYTAEERKRWQDLAGKLRAALSGHEEKRSGE